MESDGSSRNEQREGESVRQEHSRSSGSALDGFRPAISIFYNDCDLQGNMIPLPPSSSRQHPSSYGSGKKPDPYALTDAKPDSPMLSQQYAMLIHALKQRQQVYMPYLVFRPGHCQPGFSRFLCFTLNDKNSKSVAYDERLGTCIASYPCQWCKHPFKKPSALGGHLPKCPARTNNIIHVSPLQPRFYPSYHSDIYSLSSSEKFIYSQVPKSSSKPSTKHIDSNKASFLSSNTESKIKLYHD